MKEGRIIRKSERIRRYSYIFMSERGEIWASSGDNIVHLSISPFLRMQPILTLLPTQLSWGADRVPAAAHFTPHQK